MDATDQKPIDEGVVLPKLTLDPTAPAFIMPPPPPDLTQATNLTAPPRSDFDFLREGFAIQQPLEHPRPGDIETFIARVVPRVTSEQMPLAKAAFWREMYIRYDAQVLLLEGGGPDITRQMGETEVLGNVQKVELYLERLDFEKVPTLMEPTRRSEMRERVFESLRWIAAVVPHLRVLHVLIQLDLPIEEQRLSGGGVRYQDENTKRDRMLVYGIEFLLDTLRHAQYRSQSVGRVVLAIAVAYRGREKPMSIIIHQNLLLGPTGDELFRRAWQTL